MLDITEMMYESLDALTNNSSIPTTPTTPMTPMTPITPITPMTPITPATPTIPIHYNPSKTSISISLSPSSPSYIPDEIEIIQPNDNRSRRHFKIIGDIPTTNNMLPLDNDRSGHRNRHLSQISSSSTASSSDFSTLTMNTTVSSSPCPTIHDVDSYYLDDLTFEKLINFDQNTNNPDDYNNNTSFDVIINVGEEPCIKRFRSHSTILSKRSSYFRSALSTNKHGDVYLFDKPNISPKVFTTILRYMYFGSIKLERLDISTILDLLIASDELALEDFTCEIQSYLIHLNSDWLKTKIVPMLQYCYTNPTSFSKLLLHISMIIKKDPTCLLIQNNLHLLSESIINDILNECYNGLDDWAIWQCILKWALGREKINEFPYDVKKWRQYEFNMLHELMFKLVEKYVRFSHISRNYFLDKVLPYLNYWIKDVGSEVGEDANEETVLYYLSNNHHYHYHHHHNHHINTYTNNHASSSSSSSSSSIILEDSALINHIHALKITHWIQEGNLIPNVVDTAFKSKKYNSYRFILPFFRKKNRQQQNSSSISTALSISTHILTTSSTKSSTTAQFNHQQQQQQSDIKLVSTPAAYQFNLLFRMSRDGASAYHDRCMNQGPTLAIVKIKLPSSFSNNRNILVGGYNPIGFNYFPNPNYENNSSTFVFTFGDGKSFEKRDVIRMMINDDNCTKDCSKNSKISHAKTPLSMKKPLFSAKVNNLSSISINNHNRFDNGTTGLCFGNNLIINFHEKSVEFNGGQDFGLIRSDLFECEIFQVKELCY